MAKKRATIVPEVRKTNKKSTRKKAPPSSPKKRAPKKAEPPKRTPRKKAATKQKPEETVDLKEELASKLPDIDFDISTPIPRVDPAPFLSGVGDGNSIASILNIKWSKYIPFEPLPKQLAALMLADEDELLFGGALGGSKSTWLAMESLRFMDLPGYASIIFRRQLTDLKQPGGLIPKILQWLSPFQAQGLCQYHASEHIVRFKTFWPGTDIPGPDAMLQFGYIGEAAVRERYQSAEYQTCPVPETNILMADGSYKKAGDLEEGDIVQTLQGPSLITKVAKRFSPCVEVITPHGSQIHSISHKLLSEPSFDSDPRNSTKEFLSFEELSLRSSLKYQKFQTHTQKLSQDLKPIVESELSFLHPSSTDFFEESTNAEIDFEASDDELQESQQPQTLFYPLVLALPAFLTNLPCSEKDDQTEDDGVYVPMESTIEDSRCDCSFYLHQHDERAFSNQNHHKYPTTQDDAEVQTLSILQLGTKGHTQEYIPLSFDSYVHPYTKEICHHDQTISGHRLVVEECSLKALEGSFEVVSITVANHSHYISSSKLVNMNCCFDELGNWPEADDYLFMMSRLRKTVCPIHGKDAEGNAIYDQSCYQCRAISQVVPRMRAACNPGPAWIKRRFGIRPDPTQYKTSREALIAIQEGHKVRWVGSPGHPKFIPSYLWDNKHLDARAYKKLLAEMPESERSRLEDGNWESRVDARFKRKWQRFVHLHVDPELLKEYPEQYISELTKERRIYNALEGSYSYIEFDNLGNTYQSEPIPLRTLKRIFLTADPAVTVQRGPVDEQIKQKNSYTGIGVFGETRNDELLWLAGQKFRKELPDVIDAITFLNYIWKPSMNKIEASGVGIGAAQFLESAGFPVTKNWKKTDKVENSMSAQLLMRHGKILFPINALWLERMEDVIFSWTGLPSEEDDMVDVISDAGNEISLKIAREIVTHKVTKSLPCSVSSFPSGRVVVPQYGISNRHF